MKLPVPLGGSSAMCRFEGGPLDGLELLVPRGVYAVSYPVRTETGWGQVQYTVRWHDDGPVAT